MFYDILVVDDEADIRELIAGILEDEGYEVRLASNSDETLIEADKRCPSLVILDIWLQGSRLDGLQTLDELRDKYPNLPVVIISGHGNIEIAITAIKKGAYDYIEKPFKIDKLCLTLSRALEAARLEREVIELKKKSGYPDILIGNSQHVRNIRNSINKNAKSNSRILLSGPSGTGKELAARLIHDNSYRNKAPFIMFSPSALSPEHIEAELFGIENRSAEVSRHKIGLLEQAHGGTIYINKIDELPVVTQLKIIPFLTKPTFKRINGLKPIEVDVRIIASLSNNYIHNLEHNSFMEDLYQRLNIVPIILEPLAIRRDDIPNLVNYFIEHYAQSTGISPKYFDDDALILLQTAKWPGNVRQLRNNVERLQIMYSMEECKKISADHIPEDLGSETSSEINEANTEQFITLSLREARVYFEKLYLSTQISRFGGNISQTANFVGMERSALHRKLKSLGVVYNKQEKGVVHNKQENN